MKVKNIVLGVTGSIAVYKACDLIRMFQNQHITVDVIMTKEAQKFITPLTFQTLANGKVYLDMFEFISDYDPEHIALAKKADAIVVAPATANIIGKVANGIYDDLLTCVISASKAPIVFAPAMNTNMYRNIVVQDNIRRLKKIGMRFIGPKAGKLASGDVGMGCLEDIETIASSVKKIL